MDGCDTLLFSASLLEMRLVGDPVYAGKFTLTRDRVAPLGFSCIASSHWSELK